MEPVFFVFSVWPAQREEQGGGPIYRVGIALKILEDESPKDILRRLRPVSAAKFFQAKPDGVCFVLHEFARMLYAHGAGSTKAKIIALAGKLNGSDLGSRVMRERGLFFADCAVRVYLFKHLEGVYAPEAERIAALPNLARGEAFNTVERVLDDLYREIGQYDGDHYSPDTVVDLTLEAARNVAHYDNPYGAASNAAVAAIRAEAEPEALGHLQQAIEMT